MISAKKIVAQNPDALRYYLSTGLTKKQATDCCVRDYRTWHELRVIDICNRGRMSFRTTKVREAMLK